MTAIRSAARARHLFQALPSDAWINLALAACAASFVIQVALDIAWNNVCTHLGIDFCAFWSAGRASNLYGYVKAYDPVILAGIQSANLPPAGQALAVSPVAYLPVFLLPFQVLAMLPPAAGFWIWTLLNAICYVGYLRFLNRGLGTDSLQTRLLVMISLSLPVFWNFLDGQVNVWLMICLGEFMRSAISGKPVRAGLWLGGLLLKPQALVLLGLALLLQRSWRIIAGLAASSAAILTASWAMLGTSGAAAVLQTWLGFAQGIPANDVGLMMNWRMVGLHFADWGSPTVGWSLTAVAMLLTVAAGLWLWRRRIDMDSPAYLVALLGLLAATTLVAWHSNIHMAMILIPPLLLVQQKRSWPASAFNAWVLIPSAVYIFAHVLAALMKIGALPPAPGGFLDFARGASELAVNVWVLVIALSQSATSGRHVALAAAP